MDKPLVYLAGPISGVDYRSAVNWRDAATQYLSPTIATLSPMRHKESLKDKPALIHQYDDIPSTQPDYIVLRDLSDIRRASAVLLYGLDISVGTAIELGYAVRGDTPAVVVLPIDSWLRNHPFLKRLPHIALAKDLAIACDLLRSLLI